VQYDRTFSIYSYGFRAKKYAHQALKKAGKYVAAGKRFIIDLHLEKFFDEVNHHRLMWMLSTRIGDQRVLRLINKYLKAGLLPGGLRCRFSLMSYSTLQRATYPYKLRFIYRKYLGDW
jgi:hypothetical protein